ncbi:succinate dehydrogenase/fumarate reductase iron-sulfur subunit [Telmatospirillum sp. J64-1]|uniref:succinate dehydrogenase/fumarate reductase iron-sulfur subunit n=1 Tax=Telmatospirillum sp. J64-1 TaxID=2502183 RepID=UPI00115E207C|nr:succinate dehydrogenase/fumarate reductase iron-sulfur subunit [Telmatospirillum sp. J64-1]
MVGANNKPEETDQPEVMIEVSVWRGDAEAGGFRTYHVPSRQSQTVLDIVTYIQRNLDPELTYRFACRVGMCGSCGMTVNGKPRWTCRTHASQVISNGKLTIEPLRNMTKVKDLAVDMTPFFDKWVEAKGAFVPTKTRHDEIEAIKPDSKERRAADAAVECINCGVCYSACDVVAWKPDYLGPAAINRSWTLVNDPRDGAQAERLKVLASDAGCSNCHSHQSCATYCPNLLNPTRSIAGVKRRVMVAALKGEV